jgi:hypothetical protein
LQIHGETTSYVLCLADWWTNDLNMRQRAKRLRWWLLSRLLAGQAVEVALEAGWGAEDQDAGVSVALVGKGMRDATAGEDQ